MAVALLAFAGSAADAQSFKRVTSEAEFRSAVTDKKLTLGDGWVTIKSGGQTEGVISGQKFLASWVWQNKMYCRNAVLGKQQLGTDCQVVKVSGGRVQFTGKSGKGQTSEWTAAR